MKECWSEGDLRAYHDAELPPADMRRIAAHLANCPKCEELADEVAGRAVRVGMLLDGRPVGFGSPRPAARQLPGKWMAAAVALAAGIAIAVALLPKHTPETAKPQQPAFADLQPIRSDPAVPVQAAAAQTPRKLPKRTQPRQVFLALDDEPIETGVVVRVALGEAEIPADVVFGADGRAHAIRLVNSRTNY